VQFRLVSFRSGEWGIFLFWRLHHRRVVHVASKVAREQGSQGNSRRQRKEIRSTVAIREKDDDVVMTMRIV
jgi:hypothetical protein